jgi:hypothetical protein
MKEMECCAVEKGNFAIRPATISDLDALVRLFGELFSIERDLAPSTVG